MFPESDIVTHAHKSRLGGSRQNAIQTKIGVPKR
jgi:hypothetical protein